MCGMSILKQPTMSCPSCSVATVVTQWCGLFVILTAHFHSHYIIQYFLGIYELSCTKKKSAEMKQGYVYTPVVIYMCKHILKPIKMCMCVYNRCAYIFFHVFV